MDWGEYRLGRAPVYAFVSVLGYSRCLHLEYVDSTHAEVLVACHRRMLGAFGGMPREILYDKMKTVVSRRGSGPTPLPRRDLNGSFLVFLCRL
jgi:transposase